MSSYYRSILNVQAVALDPDAEAFLTAAGITDATITDAINTFVLSLKSDGIWTKMKAIYPLVGGTAATHKFNLKDPRDLDAAFRLTFFGGITHSANGIQGNGTNGYADTYLLRSVIGQNSLAFAAYSRTNQTRTEYDFGAFTATPSTTGSHFLSKISTGTAVRNQNSTAFFIPTEFTRSDGFISHWRESDSIVKVARENVIQSVTNASTAIVNDNSFYVMGANLDNSLSLPSSKQYSAMYFGQDLNETDYNNLKTANLALQTTLSRNV
jgi:hypothetical protein